MDVLFDFLGCGDVRGVIVIQNSGCYPTDKTRACIYTKQVNIKLKFVG